MSRHPNSKAMHIPTRGQNESERAYSHTPGPTRFKREPMPREWIEDARRRRRAL